MAGIQSLPRGNSVADNATGFKRLHAELNGMREYDKYGRVSMHKLRLMLRIACWWISQDSIGMLN